MTRGKSSGSSLPAEDTASPFFLHSSDNPGSVLVSHLLSDSNYNTWSRSMILALTAKNKLGFVDGSLLRPSSDDLLYAAWCRCDSMVTSWLLHAISKEIADSLLYMDSALAIWHDLYDRFHQSNGPRVFQIKKRILALTQGSNTVSNYYTQLKTLSDELRDFQLILVCNCGSMKSSMEHQSQDQVMTFLMGLNDSFAQIRA